MGDGGFFQKDLCCDEVVVFRIWLSSSSTSACSFGAFAANGRSHFWQVPAGEPRFRNVSICDGLPAGRLNHSGNDTVLSTMTVVLQFPLLVHDDDDGHIDTDTDDVGDDEVLGTIVREIMLMSQRKRLLMMLMM